MKNEFLPIYKDYIEKHGIESKMRMCIEEMSELTKELCKVQRYWGTEKQFEIENKIREEIADVLNMAEQLEYFFGEEEIEKIRQEKINRALKRDFK